MRKVGNFDTEKKALGFWNFLKRKDIQSALEKAENEQHWEIWVADEDKLDKAFLYLDEFLKDPEDERFVAVGEEEKSDLPANKSRPRRFKQFNLRDKWSISNRAPSTITLSLMITSVAVFLLSGMGKNTELVGGFFISEKLDGQLTEVFSGEIWRVITPIFLHFTFWHILFNMYWLHEFGSQIEKIKGPKFFITFLLLIALISNLTQFALSGPGFGGMSGVVYGLFGYIWVKTRLDPADGFQLDPIIPLILFGFFLLCFTGMLGGIANWAHAGGLAVGIAWGYGSAYRWNQGSRS